MGKRKEGEGSTQLDLIRPESVSMSDLLRSNQSLHKEDLLLDDEDGLGETLYDQQVLLGILDQERD